MGFRVLIVEDSKASREFIARTVERVPNVTTVTTASGFEALKILPRDNFDLIITDINMPDINGLELVSFLKNHPVYKSIPIMVISTESTDEDRRRAAALGAEEYLVKPFETSDLIEKLRRLLKVA